MEKQIAYSFDKVSLIKIAKGAGIAVGGALLVYLSQVITEVNFGVYTPIIVAIASILINTGKEWLAGNNVK